MASPMRIKARLEGDIAVVRAIMRHEMETGQRKAADGTLVSAHFIQQVVGKLNDKVVLDAQWGPAVSKNPYMEFRAKGAKAGDKVVVTWVDNKGETRTDEAIVS